MNRTSFSVRALFIGVTLIAILLAAWGRFTQRSVRIRSPDEKDVPDLSRIDDNARAKCIAVVGAKDDVQIVMQLEVFAVQNRKSHRIHTFEFERAQSPESGEFDDRAVMILLMDSENGPYRYINLNAQPVYRYSGETDPFTCPFSREYSATWRGTMLQSHDYVIYAEGNAPVELTDRTTFESFVRDHEGCYIVVNAVLK